MNQAMSHLANREVLQGVTHNRLLGQGKEVISKGEKNESSMEESKSPGEYGVSLAELWRLPLGLAAGQERSLPFSYCGSNVVALPAWSCKVPLFLLGSVTEVVLFGVTDNGHERA